MNNEEIPNADLTETDESSRESEQTPVPSRLVASSRNIRDEIRAIYAWQDLDDHQRSGGANGRGRYGRGLRRWY